MRPRPPLALEIALARAVAALSRGVGVGGGTTIPGKLLAELDRGAIDRLAARLSDGTAVLSATNGKTTATAMAAEILRPRHKLAHNAAGANLVSGVASGTPYVSAAAYVGHLGDYRCPRGDHARPPLDVAGRDIVIHGLERASFRLDTPDGSRSVELALPGLYNVYNAVAAAALSRSLGAELDEIATGLGRFSAAFGRFERVAVGDKRVLLLLIKNPAGANEAIRPLVDGGAPGILVVALNDEIADGRDVSWIWDVDF